MNKQKILNIIIVIAVIALIAIMGWVIYDQKINTEKDEPQNIAQTNTNTNTTNKVEEPENVVEEKEPEEEPVGEEEVKQPEKEKKENPEEKAIALAKETWGEDDSVTFNIEEKKGSKYYVAVKSNATVLVWYEVNTETWEISEFY